MRTLTFYMVTLASVLGLATASQAGVIIDFTSGGLQNVVAAPSSPITVDIHLTVTGAEIVSGYQFGLDYSAGGIDSLVGGLVNAPTHIGAASWVSGGPGLILDGGDGVAGAAISASTLTAGAEITAASGTVFIGSIQVHVSGTGNDALIGCFNCDPFGATGDIVVGAVSALAPDITGSVSFNGLNIVPEPTTASLLGLGLLGLGVAGRRRN